MRCTVAQATQALLLSASLLLAYPARQPPHVSRVLEHAERCKALQPEMM